MASKILLENGTNELEVLEFCISGNYYGINVAKVREVVPDQHITPIPNSHPSIAGVFMPRDVLITAIDLRNCLGIDTEPEKNGVFIITNFNKLNVAFRVDEVLGIHRISWEEIIKPGSTLSTAENSVSTGIIQKNNRLIVILDFEKIMTDINPETGLKTSDITAMGPRERSSVPILLAEDSVLLNKLIVDSLHKAGYENIVSCDNGKKAYEYILTHKKAGDLKDHVKCVITDIEMPEMDGHHLTKLIKDNEELCYLPVVIFSSLINEEMKRKGEALGANAQLSKPEIGSLIETIDNLVMKYHLEDK